MKIFNFNKKRAQKYHDLGAKLSDDGQDKKAIEAYLKAIQLDSNKSESYYNIGLIYKYELDWERSLSYNSKAHELDPDDEAACWNLAIAATALRNWAVARNAWEHLGISLDEEDGPIEMDFGLTPIRLNPESSPEVVWATRIDPARAIIDSIPYKESGFNFGDVVLHDGAAVGYREVDGNEYPVFNVLELYEKSSYSTMEVRVLLSEEKDIETLRELLSKQSLIMEDWSANVRMLCKQCSEGTPHEKHDHSLRSDNSFEKTIAVSGESLDSINTIFDKWSEITNGKLLNINT